MSYDVAIGAYDGNYTYNLSKLFHDHIRDADGNTGLQCLDGMTGKQAGELLGNAWSSIHSKYLSAWKSGDVGAPSFCQIYDAPNGWGSTVGALIFLGELTAACCASPRRRVRVS